MTILVSETPLEHLQLGDLTPRTLSTGAVASFSGYMRNTNNGRAVTSLYLDYYRDMAESQLSEIAERARQRWPINACVIAHRVGQVVPGEMLVYVETHSSHRQDAFDACNYIMDILKTAAPFWKKEQTDAGDHWVAARTSDTTALQKWQDVDTDTSAQSENDILPAGR